MYDKMIEALKLRPTPYMPGMRDLWDDAHISSHMLRSHIDPTADGATRNHDFVKKSAAWVASLREGGDLLDLGCGPGIYAELFDAHGFTVTGIDYSERSIAYARDSALQNGKKIKYVGQNYLRIAYESAFDIVTLIYCDFGVLAPDNRRRLLFKIHRALRPGGLFIMDAWTAAYYQGFEENLSVSYENGGFWSPEAYICVKSDRRYGDLVVLSQYNVMTADGVSTYNIWNEAFDQERLSRMLHAAGFLDVSFYGDVCGRAVSAEDTTICAVARK